MEEFDRFAVGKIQIAAERLSRLNYLQISIGLGYNQVIDYEVEVSNSQIVFGLLTWTQTYRDQDSRQTTMHRLLRT
jgi:hypothetical protein